MEEEEEERRRKKEEERRKREGDCGDRTQWNLNCGQRSHLLVPRTAVNDRRGDALVHVGAISDRHARDAHYTHFWCLEIIFDRRFVAICCPSK